MGRVCLKGWQGSVARRTHPIHFTAHQKLSSMLGRRLCGAAAAATAAAAVLAAPAWRACADGREEEEQQQQQLPTDKLACHRHVPPPRTPAVLVSCGSFNPPTVMHMRMFELATAALAQRGVDVWGCYMSPVADAYGKAGLAPVTHRLEMCRRAADSSAAVMVGGWEAAQPGYTRTLQVLRHVASSLAAYLQQQPQQPQQQPQHRTDAAGPHTPASRDTTLRGGASGHTTPRPRPAAAAATPPQTAAAGAQPVPRVMLLCGADLLASINTPGVWRDPDAVLREHGIVVVCRAGTDVQALLQQPGSLLAQHQQHVVVVQEPVSNDISSTKVRQLLAAGQPVRYLLPEGVLAYIQQHGLYASTQQPAAP